MKKLLPALCLFIFTTFTQAQIVNIPDANFKTWLIDYMPVIDTNHDNEIQVSEAQAVTSLIINDNQGFIADVTGIEAFTNLTSLSMTYISGAGFTPSVFTHLQSLNCHTMTFPSALDFSGLTNLRTLNLEDAHMPGLNLSGLVNLEYLNCNDSGLHGTLDLTGLSSLLTANCNFNTNMTSLITTGANNVTHLDCQGSGLSSLNVTNMTHLEYLDCSEQQYGGSIGISTLDLTGLTALTFLNCYGNNLTSLNVAPLTNLTSLFCSNNHLTSLDVAPLVNLTHLDCSYNPITSLNLAALTQLISLNCSSTSISSINLNTLTNLIYLNIGYNNLSTLDLSNNLNLEELSCYNNHLTALPISNLVNLTHLQCYSNQLTALDLTNLHALQEIRTGANLFTSLDVSQNHAVAAQGVFINDCPNLTYVNGKNGTWPGGMNQTYGFDVSNCPNLQAICVNEEDIPGMTQQITAGQFGTTPTTVQVNSYCSFAPGGINNMITGQMTLDLNHNGCDINDIHPVNFKININDGTTIGATFTSNAGNYSFYTQTGAITITPQIDNPYFTTTPATSTLNFANLDGTIQTQNFCITQNGIHNDVDVVIYPIRNARPGFDANYAVTYKNKGTEILSGDIDVSFDDSVFDFISANPTLNSQSLNHLIWNYSNLSPFESRTIYFTLNLNSPVETPPVNIDDVLYFTATINPISGDETSDDNIFHLAQTVRGSLDPNDKTCLQGNTITPVMVGGYLDYVIRFQNTGSYYAENVVVKDVIDTTKFDINSLELTASSHPQTTRVTGNKVEFIFENINLPAQIDNEPASHGFIAFKIKTKNNLVLGNQAQNTANIYFDFNAPVMTNTTSTTVSLLNINEAETNGVSMSPIPVKTLLQINALDNINSVEVFDIQGRLLQATTAGALSTTVDFTGKSKGIYLVKVYTSKGVKTQKIIKE